jgi:hypothetical protein
MFWYWYILVFNFFGGVLGISLIGKERQIYTSGVAAFGVLLTAVETFAFWRVYDNKLVGIPIAITIFSIMQAAIYINVIDKPPKTEVWTLQRVLFGSFMCGLTIVAAVVLQRAN